MANHVNVTIDANVQGYVDGINQAKQATAQYQTETKKVKDNVGNFRKEFAAAKKDVMNLAQAYRSLSNEEKQSQFGMEIAKQLQAAKEKAAEMTDLMSDMNAELKNMASDTATLDVLSEGMGVLANTASTAAGAIAWVTGNEEDAKNAVVAFTTATSALNAVTKIQKMLQMQSATMLAVTKVQTLAATAAENIKTAATVKGTVATNAATVAQAAFNAVANANPYVLLATAILGVASALWMFSSGSEEAEVKTNELTIAEENAKKAHEAYADALNSEYAKLMTNYAKLKAQWANLTNDTARDQWIKDHKNELKALGVEINNTKEAEGYFNKNTNEIVKAFQRRAQAAAYTTKLTQLYLQQMQLLDRYEEWRQTKGVRAGEQVYEEPGIINKDANGNTYNGGRYYMDNNILKYTQKGADEINKAMPAYKDMDAEFKRLSVEITKYSNGLAALVDVQDEVTNNTKEHNKTVKREISTYKEAIAEYDKLVKEKTELEQLMKDGRVDPEFLESFKKEIADYDKKIQELVDKWHIKAKVEVEAPQKSDLDKISNEINNALNPKKSKSESYDYSALPEEFNKSASEVINSMKRIETARESLIKTMNSTDSTDAEIATAQDGLIQLNSAYDELASKADVYQELCDAAEKLDKENQNVVKTANNIGDALQAAGEMFTALGEVTKDKGLKVTGLVAQAIATVALSYANALNSAKSWVDWLAFGLSGAATMINLIAQIKSATAGSYAEGGIVGGHSYTGDKLMAFVNSDEAILNTKQQRKIVNALDYSGGGYTSKIEIEDMQIRGSDLYIMFKNYEKSHTIGTNKNIRR